MTNKVVKNYIYNIIYQIAVLIIPLVTAPYLARILGAEGIGIYSYNYSIVYYFSLFVMLGVNNYGNRSIAKCLGEKEKIHKTFWEIYLMQLMMGIIIIGLYLIYVMAFVDMKVLALCYLPFIISYALDVNWYFFGQENFKIILIRNIVIKFITAAGIFSFVKESNDVIKYILIMSSGALLSQIIVWILILKQKSFIRPSFSSVFRHLKPNFVLFIPTIAVNIYRTMDKIMLGSMSNMTQVGYYENAEKIISILLTFITALGTVMLPRMSSLYEAKDDKQIKKMLGDSFLFVSLMASIISFGVAIIADNFVVIYYGKDYLASGIILQILCLTIPCISYANIIRMQIIVPQGKDRTYIISCFTGAIINVILNYFLIPKYYSIGAAIGTVGAEIAVLGVQYFSVRKELEFKKYIKYIGIFWINGLIMFVLVNFILHKLDFGFISLIKRILLGAIVYLSLIFVEAKVMKIDLFYTIFEKVFSKLKNKFFMREDK